MNTQTKRHWHYKLQAYQRGLISKTLGLCKQRVSTDSACHWSSCFTMAV